MPHSRASSTIPAELAQLDFRVPARVLRPGPVARVHARLRPAKLDRELASGADPSATAALAHRAARLTSPAGRAWAADCLDRMLGRAQEPPGAHRLQMAPARAAVLEHRAELLDLAERMRAPEPLYVRGLAMLSVLMSDGTGPLYAGAGGAQLGAELGAVRSALAS